MSILPDLSSPRKQKVGLDFSGVNVVTRWIMQQGKIQLTPHCLVVTSHEKRCRQRSTLPFPLPSVVLCIHIRRPFARQAF